MGFATRVREVVVRTLSLRQAVGMVYSASPRLFAASVFLVLVQSVLPVVVLYATKLMIDDITTQLAQAPEARDFSRVLSLIALVGGVTLFNILIGTLAALVSDIQSDVVSDSIMSGIHLKSVEVDLAYYENAQVFNALHRAQADAPFRPPRIVMALLRIAQSSVSLIAMIGLLATVNIVIALIVFAAALPRLVVRLWSSRVLHGWLMRRAATERLLVYYNYMLTLAYFAKEMRLFDLGRLFSQRYDQTRVILRGEKINISVRRSLFDLGAQSISVIALSIAYAVIAQNALIGGITIGTLVIGFQAFQQAQSYFGDILSQLASLYEDSLFLQNYYRFMELKPDLIKPESPLPVPNPMRQGIRFENVSFSYSSSTTPVLEDINLEIKPGETVALVGENGAGKTTLVKLLCRLYDPTSGRITLDGIDLRAFDPAELRHSVGVIFQDYAMYAMTAAENIWVGDVSSPLDRARIEMAARKSEAHPVIEALPQGYDTLLGEWFENSRQLSIGQWQKVALGRAFFRDAQMMILDEPTAALDVMTEAAVFSHFRQIAEGKTALLISHRLSTVRMADRIMVLDKSHIVEQGTHDELIARDGIYATLFRTQAQNYLTNEPLTPSTRPDLQP